MTTIDRPLNTYLVRVGHLEIRVRAEDVDDAIRLTRLQMARELPRLYDVIRELTVGRFEVEAAA